MNNKKLVLTAPKKNGGGSANRNIMQLINFGGFIQFSVPNPPLLLAAKRYAQLLEDSASNLDII